MGKGVRHRQILNTHIKTHISVPTSLKVSLCQITLVLHVFWNTLIDICGVIFLCNLTSSIDLNPWVKDSDAKSAGKLIDPVLKTERDRHRTKYILIYCIFSTAFLTVPAWTDSLHTAAIYKLYVYVRAAIYCTWCFKTCPKYSECSTPFIVSTNLECYYLFLPNYYTISSWLQFRKKWPKKCLWLLL